MSDPVVVRTEMSGNPVEQVLQARWLTPDCERLLSPGCVHIREGRIVRAWEGTDADAVDLGAVAIVPGLINAHTHLEFSDLAEPIAAEAAFPDWIRAVIQSRRTRPANRDGRATIRRGWEECVAAGTVAIGEIATSDEMFDELLQCGARGVVFREVLGLQAEAVAAGLETARQHVGWAVPTTAEGTAHPTLRRGLSPHAPYSLHPALFRGLVQLAVDSNVPVAMHLAETREELDLLAHHRGGIVDLLQSLGLWRPELFSDFRRPLDYLHELSRCQSALVVHGNYLTDEELDFLATQPQMTVVYCPRTHAAFGHEPHPWKRMRERGIRVVFGTDSRASNPDLSLLNELQWLHGRHPEATVPVLLKMATAVAAEGLGLSHELGTLDPGKRAALTLIAPQAFGADDWRQLFR